MPQGPFGGMRPIATSSVNFVFNVESSTGFQEVVIEQLLRQKMTNEGYNDLRHLTVTVSEANNPNYQMITVITDLDDVSLDRLLKIWSTVEDHVGKEIPEEDVDIRAT